jgi:hypothetical protein
VFASLDHKFWLCRQFAVKDEVRLKVDRNGSAERLMPGEKAVEQVGTVVLQISGQPISGI